MKERYMPVIAIGSMLAVMFAFSPLIWALARWHCWWHVSAPVCL